MARSVVCESGGVFDVNNVPVNILTSPLSGNLDANSHKVTNLANGSNPQDAAAFGQIPTALPPSGSAGGDLGGTYPNPTVVAVEETSGPTRLALGAIANGDYLTRSGSSIVGGSPTPGGPPTGAAGGDLSGTYPNPGVAKVNGVAVTGTPSTGYLIVATGASAATWQAPPAAPIGSSALVYRYTVTGSDKASIDTGADTPNAGSNDWTNGDLLEVFLLVRTDQAGATSQIAVTLNNDSGSNYDRHVISGVNTTVATAGALAQTSWAFSVEGSSYPTSWASSIALVIPGYAGTTFMKSANVQTTRQDSSATNDAIINGALNYRSTSAITRLAVACVTGGQKLKVGTTLIIYKRLAS